MIRLPQQRRWDREAEGFGGLEADHQLKRGRLLDGKVTGLGTFEDLVHVGGCSRTTSACLGPYDISP
jgi:hypothetical protein